MGNVIDTVKSSEDVKKSCSYGMNTLLEPYTLLAWRQLVAVVTIYKGRKIVITEG